MGSYFKFRFIMGIISIGLVSVLIIVIAVTGIYYKLSEYLKKRIGRK